MSFSYIHAAILVPNCATSQCHSTLSKAGKTGRYDLQDRDSAYVVFVNTPTQHDTIVNLLNARNKDKPRMPPDQPLPKADIALIQKWFEEGMQDN